MTHRSINATAIQDISPYIDPLEGSASPADNPVRPSATETNGAAFCARRPTKAIRTGVPTAPGLWPGTGAEAPPPLPYSALRSWSAQVPTTPSAALRAAWAISAARMPKSSIN